MTNFSFKLFFILILLNLKWTLQSNEPYKIVCYFTNWAVQRPGLGAMTPEQIDPCLCTHLIYAFSEMEDNKLTPIEKYDHADGNKPGFFERLNQLKQLNPKLRTLLAVGGWDMGMSDFTNMVKSDKNIQKFVETTIEYLRKWDFDGLDLDYEYPGIDWRGSPPEDKKGFTKLCKMLREAFDDEASETGKERLLLTAAVAGAKNTIDRAYEVDKLSEYLDWFNLMTYDLHGPWDTNAGHHSAIHGKDKQDYLYIDYIVKYYESKGSPRDKLVLGLASYGRSDSPAMPYTGYKGESGFVSYYETCLMLSCESWKEFWNDKQLVPYIKGKENYPWAGYDNVRSMEIKAKYIIEEELLGAMFWTIDLDDFTGEFCCQGHFPLIRTVKSVLENDPSLMPKTTICDKCTNKEYKNLKKKTHRKRRDSPSAQEVCAEKGEGSWIDPDDCTVYYLCRSLGNAWAEEKRELCYPGSYFDQAASSCKWVGGTIDCSSLVEPTEEKTSKKPKERNSKTTTKNAKAKNAVSSNKKTTTYASIKDDVRVLPKEAYTCKAETNTNTEAETDYMKCYSCENNFKEVDKCKYTNRTAISTTKCLKKRHNCYTKIVRNKTNNQIELFTRGCIAIDDLDFNATNVTTHCLDRSTKLRTCYSLCDNGLCNDLTNIEEKSSAVNLYFSFNLILLNLFLLFLIFVY